MVTSKSTDRVWSRTVGIGLACLLLVLLSGSCSTDKPAQPVAGSGQSAPPSQAAAARTTLRAADYLLTEGPETTGFQASTSLDNRGALSVAAMTDFASCMRQSATDADVKPLDSAKGPYFNTIDSQVFMGSVAAIYPSEIIARAARLSAESSFPSCVGKLLQREYAGAADLPEGSTFTVASASARRPPAGVNAMTRVNATMVIDGPPVPMTFDLMFVFSGQIQSSFVVGRVFDAPEQAVVQRVAKQVVRKVTGK